MTGFANGGGLKLTALAAVMVLLWLLASPDAPSEDEQDMWDRVRAAQQHMTAWRARTGTAPPAGIDRHECGLIGIEWSGITTTLGSLEAKRTACDPAWSVRFSRWFAEAGLESGDRVAIYASGSFPGLLLNALAAAEAMDLDPFLVVSLGASTWGANHPDAPWPALAAELRRGGFLIKRADFYTLGGDAETGGGIAPEGVSLLSEAAREVDVEVLTADGLNDMVALKTDLLEKHNIRLLVSIGGSHANMGDDPDVLGLKPGLHRPGTSNATGNGVIARALTAGLPVLHMLNIRGLAGAEGIPFDRAPARVAPARIRPAWALLGLALFFTALLTHRRWRLV
jgi:poly-gamma-glutamate system protein